MRPARTATPSWRDPKRYLWLLGAAVPGLVATSWLLVSVTGVGAFWWTGPVLAFTAVPALDHLIGPDTRNPPDSVVARLENDRYYRWVTYLYLPNQYGSTLLACWFWAGGGWITMNFLDKVGLMMTLGLVGGLGINAAHDLGHTRDRSDRWLARLALAQTWYGHFPVEHNRGHHVRVATVEDPGSARFGESVYAFVPRSVFGGARSAWELEARRLSRQGKSRWTLRNEVLSAWLISLVLFAVLAVWFRPVVLPWLVGQAVVGVGLLESISYVEHYGLRRQKLASGRYERVRPSHAWNSNTVVASAFLFHLQRHSDHHTHPSRRYQALRHFDESPQLPKGYSTMLLVAMIPPLWRRVMDPRVLAFYGGDVTLTALKPNR